MNVAVVGATGAVGETILRLLEERDLPIGELGPFASRACGAAVVFRGERVDVRAASSDALREFGVVFFAGGEDASEEYAPALIARGSVVIDNSATFRMRDGLPLIVPSINAESLRADQRLFPIANCTAIILSMALRPVRDVAGLRSVRVATYQAASGAGRAGLDEFLQDERAVACGDSEPKPVVFPRPLARNVVPQVGAFDASGWTGEERKVCDETRKLLDLPDLLVCATAVRVPVRTAHSEAVFFETQCPTSRHELATAFTSAPEIVFHPDGIVTPREVEGTDDVHVARLRAESFVRRAGRDDTAADDKGSNFTLWCVGDQLRAGAATNAVQILELLLAKGYVAA